MCRFPYFPHCVLEFSDHSALPIRPSEFLLQDEALDQLNTEYLLGSVHYNRLGYYSEDFKSGWFTGVYRDAELAFQAALATVTTTIDARNKVVGTMRGDGNAYEILRPANVPNSINI